MVVLAAAARARAAMPCGPADDPCIVQASITLDDPAGETISIGTRALVIAPGVTVRTVAGPLTLQAGSVTLAPGARIVSAGKVYGQDVTIAASPGDIRIQADATGAATIDLSGPVQGGALQMTADGDIVVDGTLVGRSGKVGYGGIIQLTSVHGNVALNGIRPVDISSGTLGTGGLLAVAAQAGGIVVNGRLDVAGGDGGILRLTAATTVVSTVAGRLVVNSTGSGGSGGEVDIQGQSGVSLAGLIDGRGHVGGYGSGDGAYVSLAGDTILLAGTLNLAGASPDGRGGTLDVTGGDITTTGRILAAGKGIYGCGGDVRMQMSRAVVLGGTDVSGGSCGGGTVTVRSAGAVTLVGAIAADGRRAYGYAGTIDVQADEVVVSSTVNADARLGSGLIVLHGCSLTVQPGAQLTTLGAYGRNVLQSNGEMTIAGPVVSGGGSCSAGATQYNPCTRDADCQAPGLCVETGQNTFAYADPLRVPVVSAPVSPATVPVLTALGPCTGP